MSSAFTATCGTYKSVKLVTEEALPGKQLDKAAAPRSSDVFGSSDYPAGSHPAETVYGQIRRRDPQKGTANLPGKELALLPRTVRFLTLPRKACRLQFAQVFLHSLPRYTSVVSPTISPAVAAASCPWAPFAPTSSLADIKR